MPRSFLDLLEPLPEILTTGEVAKLFRVDPKTVAQWDDVLKPFRTVGGDRRFRKERIAVIFANHFP